MKKGSCSRRTFLKRAAAGAASGLAVTTGCATTSPASSRAQGRPNVLWLMTDEQRTDSLGCYGSPWAVSPNIDAFAREGVVFRNAATPSPLCTPARCSLLTGLYPSETGVWSNHEKQSDPLPHLTHVFENAGYRTASFGKQHYSTKNRAFQDEEEIVLTDAVGYFGYAPKYPMEQYDVVQYPGPKYKWIFGGRFPEPLENTSEYRVVQKAKEWLSATSSSEPFLLRLSFNAPHTPVSVAAPFDTAIPEDAIHLPAGAEEFPDYAPEALRSLREVSRSDRLTREQIRKLRRYYYGLTSCIDHLFGDLLKWMRERHLLDNTIVAYVSDHGAHLGDFGMFQKQTFFAPALDVPYLFWYPAKVKCGVTLNTPVSTTGLMPTLLELSGIDAPRSCRDRSLASTLTRGREPQCRPIFSGHSLASFELYPKKLNVMVRDGDWKMSMWQAPDAGGRTLVNLAADPYERRNRIDDADCREIRERLTRCIMDHLAAGRAPDPVAC